ncbi:MAG: hypothetical protein SGJ27_21205 [Candidatus Melainabacteria bacterium]|nr:hypothetical protein [Candidatus Melainabacteria bacterium]
MTKKIPQINVAVNFEEGRGFGPMGAGLPTNFLTFDRGYVCGTIAALYHNPSDDDGTRRTNTSSRALTQLAMYAGGFGVTLDTRQFRKLERKVREYAGIMEAPQYATTNNLAFARYVLRHAAARAKVEKVI